MAKKIRFPLILSDGTQARSLDELKEHFDLESVLGHYKSGKLLTWLRDRYIETEAEAIESLDENAPDFQQKLCEIFGVEFSGSGVDMEEVARRHERMAKLRQFTDEDEFIQNVDTVAFDQEELIDLLDEGCEKIYLCGEKFTVPASQKNKTYIGINSPKVKISGTIGDDWAERNIVFKRCEAENVPVTVQAEISPVISDEGPVIFTDELVGDIFEAIFENVPDDVYGREIIAETDHYYVIEEQMKCENNLNPPISALRYWRFSKKSCDFEELPDLALFSVTSKYNKIDRGTHGLFGITNRAIKSLYGSNNQTLYRAPTYSHDDQLYMQELSNDKAPSIWCLNLRSKELSKLIDGIRFLCPRLPATVFPCDGRYIPVLQGSKLCVLDICRTELIKVRNKGQSIDSPYGAVVVDEKIFFSVDETQIGRSDDCKGALCSYDFKKNKFAEINVSYLVNGKADGTLLTEKQFRGQFVGEQRYRFNEYFDTRTTGLWQYGNQIAIFLGSINDMLLNTSTHPMQAKRLEGSHQFFFTGSYLWYDEMVCLSVDEGTELCFLDFSTFQESETIKIGARCDTVFARIGDYIYLCDECDTKGYRISLKKPYERNVLNLNKVYVITSDRFEWKE